MKQENKIDALQQEISEANAKNERLFHTLTDAYAKLYNFDRSMIGRIVWLFEKLYLLIRLAPRRRTLYRLVVDQARLHSVTYNINYNDLKEREGRLSLLIRIIGYFIRHPYSSIRLISWYRTKKLFRVLFKGELGAANNWISERFPNDTVSNFIPRIFPLSEELDSIELEFPVFQEVSVSIVIPVYNQYRSTVSCLQAVLENTEDIAYEIIIGDDGSSDLTQSISDRIHNIKVVKAEKNQGFLKNCNHAVKAATGDYVVLLNNDTNVQKNWLKALLDTIEDNPSVGLVGPKLVFEDGILQEAGGIVWQDGSGWNVGRTQNAFAPEFNYTREADYVSGACFLLKRALWNELSGFDELFCPAYYEDTDLAFQVRAAGLKVMYQPQSVVVHFEGVSNGTDLNSGVKRHQLINQRKFLNKWKKELRAYYFKNGHSLFVARDRSANKKTVVFIDHYVPFYDKDAGSRSTFRYVELMVKMGINVKFIGANFFPHQPYTQKLQEMGVEVLYGERYAKNWRLWFQDNAQFIDVVYLHRPHITEDFIDFFADLKNCPKLIYFGHDLHYLRCQREARLLNDSKLEKQAEDWRRREWDIYRKVDLVLYPSQVEVDEIKRVDQSISVKAIPLYPVVALEEGSYRHSERSDLLFVGGFGHPPNIDAVEWFVSDVFPSVLDQIPDIRFHIVGSNVPDGIRELACNNIVIHGFVSDEELAELYSQVRICIVPLRFGAGVKGKILEALQAGLPIITTSVGAEGLPEADKLMAIADNEAEMAEKVCQIYQDEMKVKSYLQHYSGYIDQYFSAGCIEKIITQDFIGS